ncbi:DUF3017 domain-containing protein [Luteipulveratus sp. YIM 133132]|uniref:DUF3017 domain-containing protein n=1 Tax=Luteipulveratus flavus TaxID=3031728 RepID=A0ABT6C478_9MICO|nr:MULTISPECIES: DUF3017 domain-containing protein [unclassified Luteipulveratus]MDE9367112.1 DUF3017 domain-containing protein [Luteipulveratus sp. YIM 133132]MDF8263102.1 DUF3017 domain-containing protein [Luteipulveratus sp. YIM 133296]
MIPSRLGPVWWFLASGCAVAVTVMVVGPLRTGGYLLAAVLVLAALARLVLPGSLCAGVAVRSRFLDAVMYVALAAAIAVIFEQVKLP